MAAEIDGFYGSGHTPCTVFVYQNRDGSSWYVVEDSVNVNKTYQDLEDGVDIELLEDVDMFTAGSPINSVDDLVREIDGEDEDEDEEGKLYPGERVSISFDGDYNNLTKDAFISMAKDVVPSFIELQEFLEEVRKDTQYVSDNQIDRAIKNIMYPDGMSNWSSSEIDELYSRIPTNETFEKISAFTGVKVPDNINEHDLECDYSSNNFRALGHSVADISHFYSEAMGILKKDKIPYLDLDMVGNLSDQINRSADEIYTPIYGFAYPLGLSPSEQELVSLMDSAPDITIIEIDGDCYICSNSSEMNMNQVRNAYEIIDGDIPTSIQEDSAEAISQLVKDAQHQKLDDRSL